MSAHTRPNAEQIAEQAAHWIVLLSADDATERAAARAGYAAWKAADPLHAMAADGMEHLLGQVQSVRAPAGGNARPARAALMAAITPRRRRTGRIAGAAAAAALVMASALLAGKGPSYLLADLRSPTGQWRTQTLADGSRITLGSDSAVNVHFGALRGIWNWCAARSWSRWPRMRSGPLSSTATAPPCARWARALPCARSTTPRY